MQLVIRLTMSLFFSHGRQRFASGQLQLSRKLLLITTLLVLATSTLLSQEQLYQGTVLDENNLPLVFASVQVANTTRGVFTDLDGHFSLEAAPGERIVISYVAYEQQDLLLSEEQKLRIQLTPTGLLLEEVVVRPKENPAWRIIRRALANKDLHDPAQLPGYTYDAYHKTVLSVDSLNYATPQKKTRPNTPAREKRAAARAAYEAKIKRRQDLFLNEMHMWVTETRSRHLFRAPRQFKETILATQSSLPNDFTGGINPINFQPFGFYQEVIRMEITDQNYVNPLSEGTFRHYDFLLADTILHATDTTFVIRFRPLANKNFTALQGLLYINTDGYAIENVIAAPADSTQSLQFSIQQQSVRVDGRWFPQLLHADLFIQMGMAGNFVGYGFRNRSILSNITLEPPAARYFNHYLKENEAHSNHMPDSLRLAPLQAREQNTYAYWDSLPELQTAYRVLKSYNGLVRVMSSGLWTGEHLDVVVPDLWRVNAYEGSRFGLGLKTNPRLLKHLSIYAYGAYGIRDQAWKYGGALEAKLYRHRDIRLRASYSNDLIAPGGLPFLSAINNPWASWSARNLILEQLDWQEEVRADLIYRPHGSWQLNAFLSRSQRRPTYTYRYGEEGSASDTDFRLTETGILLRWAPKEKLVKMQEVEAILYPTFPIIDLSAAQLFFANQNQAVQKLSARLQHEQRWKYLGVTELSVQAGWLSESVPYPFLFQAPGNRGNSISSGAVFNTAGVTEFAHDLFLQGFFTHRFGSLLGRNRTPYFRPELRLIQQLGWGKLRKRELHQDIILNDMRHLFLESGLGVDNIIRIPYFKAVYFGLGGSVWYRWGAYHLPELKDNFHFQLTFNISV